MAASEHGHGSTDPGGHDAAPVETPEQAADRERSAGVERAVAQAVARPLGRVLAIGGAGTSLALLSQFGPAASPNGWLWLLLSILATTWGLALIRHARESTADPAPD